MVKFNNSVPIRTPQQHPADQEIADTLREGMAIMRFLGATVETVSEVAARAIGNIPPVTEQASLRPRHHETAARIQSEYGIPQEETLQFYQDTQTVLSMDQQEDCPISVLTSTIILKDGQVYMTKDLDIGSVSIRLL